MRYLFTTWKLITGILLVFVLSGCSVTSTARWLDDRAGEVLTLFEEEKFQEIETLKEVVKEIQETKKNENIKSANAGELTKEQKVRIDEWLTENEYNRYGDPEGTYYPGGTPLFDEKTGKAIERYEYLLERRPEINEVLN